MSYDLFFYFRARPKKLPQPSRNAAVTIDGPDEVDHDEIPEGYRRLLSGRTYFVTISGSGGAREMFHELERKKSELVATYADVIVLDHQRGKAVVKGMEVDLPRAGGGSQTFTTISLWFEDGVGFEGAMFDAFIDLMKRHIPKALPRRYGPLSGPMSTLAKIGLAAFKSEWRKNTNILWYANAPFEFVHSAIRNDARMFPNGLPGRFATDYRCSCISVVGEAKICEDIALLHSIFNFTAESAVLTGVFYGAIWVDAGGPETTWWWQGIPARPPVVAIVGAPYLSLWPEFRKISRPLGSAHRIASTIVEPTTEAIEIPPRLADARDRNARAAFVEGYAPVFPFSK